MAAIGLVSFIPYSCDCHGGVRGDRFGGGITCRPEGRARQEASEAAAKLETTSSPVFGSHIAILCMDQRDTWGCVDQGDGLCTLGMEGVGGR